MIIDEQLKLIDTTLAMIVRDEIMNSAGGIELFLDTHLPFFDNAVIVDTGSIDGTKEILDEYKKKYNYLDVHNIEFVGFAEARNYSLSHVKTKRAFILDADELFCPSDFADLDIIMRENPEIEEFGFNFLRLRDEGGYLMSSMGYFVGRLFYVDDHFFKNSSGKHYEDPVKIKSHKKAYEHLSSPMIKHFEPKENTKDGWYENELYLKVNPHYHANVNGWKEVNFWRRFYPYPSADAVDKVVDNARFGPFSLGYFPFGLERICDEDLYAFSFPNDLNEMLIEFRKNNVLGGRMLHSFNEWRRMSKSFDYGTYSFK